MLEQPHPWRKASPRALVAHRRAGPRGEVPLWWAGTETSPPPPGRTCQAAFTRSQNQELWVGRNWVCLGWLARRAGQGVQSGCRVRNGLIEKPQELLGGVRDGRGDSSTWLSPLLVPELPSLAWMRVRPRDSTVPRGTTQPDTSVTPMAPSVGHCWVPLAERGWWHLPRGPAFSHHTWDLDRAGPCTGGGTAPSTRVGQGMGQGTPGCPCGGDSAPAPPLRAGCGNPT